MLEWHPFTLSSGPDDDELEIVIKNLGDATRAIVTAASDVTSLSLRVDGPYGGFRPDYRRFSTLVLVAGGVGVTPMLSALRALYRTDMSSEAQQREARGQHHVEHVFFLWACPTLALYEAFSKVLTTAEARSGTPGFPTLHNNSYLTRETVAPPGLLLGRPDVDQVFDHVRKVASTTASQRVGLFACGPLALVNAAWDRATAASKDSHVCFDVHLEAFEM